MNILNKFTIKSLILNKKRTIVTIIGIILSTSMICATAGLISTFQKTMIETTKNDTGDYYLKLSDVPKEEKDNIINQKEVAGSMISQNIGYAKLEGGKNEYKPYLFLKEYDENALRNYDINLIEGRLPKNSNEIIISESIESNGGKTYNIGDKLMLDICLRKIGNDTLWQNNPIYTYDEDDNRDLNQIETLEKLYQKEYEVVGIMERISSEPYSAPGYTIISKLENYNDNIEILLKTKSAKGIYEFADKINGVNLNNKEEKYDTSYNNELLRYMGVSKNDNVNSMLYGLAAVIIGIIIITSVFVIRNSFDISVTERLRQYGMLASIGATPKQIKHNVLFEGFILGLISIPFGILGGLLAVYVLTMLVETLLSSALNGVEFVYSISLISVLVSIVLGFVTILLSALIPGLKASKTSPIDAIRSSSDIKIKGKKLRTSKLFNNIFGVEGQIALKNLKRSKKKYRTTVISIFVSIVVFISLSTFIDYGFKMGNLYYEELNFNVHIYPKSHDMDNDILDYYTKISKLNNIERYSISKYASFSIDKKYLTDDANSAFKEDEIGSVQLIAVGNDEYNKYIEELGLDKKECSSKGILIDTINKYMDSKYKEFNYLNVKDGEKVILNKQNNEAGTIALDIVKRTTKCPTGISAPYNLAYIIVSDEYIENYQYEIGSISINSSNSYKLIQDIENMNKEMYNNVYTSNYDEYMKQNNALILVMSIFLYGFIAVISLIGITNIFNTITTNMALRSKEFAILKSIGMTDKEFNKMINLESLLYGFKSLIYGIPVGIVLSYLIYSNITNMLETSYMLPVKAILICVVFVFITIFITMGYSKKKVNSQNIIDTIRNENI